MSDTGRQAQALAERWAEEFASVMEAMGDVRPQMHVAAGAPEAHPAVLWWMQPMDACPGAAVWAGADEATWLALGNVVLAAAGVESSPPDEVKDTWLEVLKQSLGSLARFIGTKTGGEVTCTGGSEEPPAATAAAFQIALEVPGNNLHPVALHFSGELLAALQPAQAESGEQSAAELPSSLPAPVPQTDEPDLPAGAARKLELLLDVEMPVSVSFGSTQVRMRDVLKLITGSIIELDRSISEPVEVLVNNCVVARGEVVVVDGNYGVRINEVMSRRQRLQESRKFLLPVGSRK